MEAIVRRSLLYDFYGALLTEHQKRIYEEVYFGDFSVSEVARDEGISRQGVHDLIKRCDSALEAYEAQLHLVERFLSVREGVEQIRALCERDKGTNEDGTLAEIAKIAARIREDL